jgi:hypothetical protein
LVMYEIVVGPVGFTQILESFAKDGDAPQNMNQKVLKLGCFFRFSAHPLDGAACVFAVS